MSSSHPPMPIPPVALQLYSIREDTKVDFARAVAEVARMGYTGVELAGYGNLDARGAQAALLSAGLKIAGMHVGRQALRSELPRVIAEARLLGVKNLVCPSWPVEELGSVADVEKMGMELNTIGAALRSEGFQLSFHNHAPEFKLLEGRPVFSWLLGASEPRNLTAELDVYWAHFAGYSPSRFLHEQGQRVRLVHLKDETEIGLGPVNFAEVFTAAEATESVEWYIVEQEKYHHTPLESVRLCIDQLKRWGKA